MRCRTPTDSFIPAQKRCVQVSKRSFRAFYRDVMGFVVETARGNWVSFRVGVTLLSLRPRGAWAVCDDGQSVPGVGVGPACIPRPEDKIIEIYAEY
jgi:hypothetical protein